LIINQFIHQIKLAKTKLADIRFYMKLVVPSMLDESVHQSQQVVYILQRAIIKIKKRDVFVFKSDFFHLD